MDKIALCAILSYLIGSIPFGLVVTKWCTGKNLRTEGSGNIGATNALRSGGRFVGAVTLILDAGKGFLCSMLAIQTGYSLEFASLFGLCAFLGHCFPVWLRFNGGKGVATAFGVFAALSWWLLASALIGFGLGYALFRQAGAGSLLGSCAAATASFVIMPSFVVNTVLVFMVVIIAFRHTDNIRRLFTRNSVSLLVIPFLGCTTVSVVSRHALELENQCIQSLAASDYEGAQSRCELCLEYDETVAECLNGLGLVAYARGDFDLAKKKFTRAIQMKPSFGQARNNLGTIHFKDGNYSEALTLYLAALQLDPGYEDARYNAGLSHLRLAQQSAKAGDKDAARASYAQAKSHYQKLLVIDPENMNALNDLNLIDGDLQKLDGKDRQ